MGIPEPNPPPELDRFLNRDDDQTISTPLSGELVLNPKVKGVPSVPLCPSCEKRIQRVEHPNDLVEFKCGCDELQRFSFPERSDF